MKNEVWFIEREFEKPDHLTDEDTLAGNRSSNARLVKEGMNWMREHQSGEVGNPRVNEARFEASAGYEFASYMLNQRIH